MKRKIWEVRVKDNPNQTASGENDQFYTTDTEAFLIFELVDENFQPTAATLTLENRTNGMLDSVKVPVTNGRIVWEMTEQYIGHSGTWYVQIEYELMKGNILEKYTSAPMKFTVNPHIADRKKPSVVQVDNWRTFMEESSSVIDRVQERINTGEFDGTITFEELTPGQIEMLRGHEGKGLEYIWDGTQLGIRVEGETTYNYVDLKGDKGDPSTWASLEGKPTTFKPESHTHKISEVTGLSAELGNTAVIQDLKNDVANLKSQKGSNQHGHWIKRADGVMTTWSTFQLSGEPDDKWGELYYWQPDPVHITFPQAFIEAPSIQYTHFGSHFLWTQATNRHRAENISGYRGEGTPVPPVTVTLKATGRWSEAVDGNFFKGRDLPNYWRSHLTNKINTINQQHNKHEDNFSFAFITDLHMDTNVGNSFSIVKILLENTDIENVIVGGDYVVNPAITPKSKVLRQIKEVVDGYTPYWERVMMVIGNHDENSTSSRWVETLMPSEQYDTMLKQMGAVVYGGNKTYYYKDDTVSRVRYIVLNSIDIPYIQDGIGLKHIGIRTFAYSQAQINWLANTALRTPGDDWTVVVSSHTPPYKGNMKAYDYPTHNEELARGLVKAYKDKSSYSGSSKSGTPSDMTASVSADYSNGGGDVAVWLSGHVHYDNVVMTPEGVPLITTLNDGGRRWLDSPIRTAGTIREQALDVITVNRNERKLYLTRVGAGADRVVSY